MVNYTPCFILWLWRRLWLSALVPVCHPCLFVCAILWVRHMPYQCSLDSFGLFVRWVGYFACVLPTNPIIWTLGTLSQHFSVLCTCINAWSIELALATPFALTYLWGSLPYMFQRVSRNKLPFGALARPLLVFKVTQVAGLFVYHSIVKVDHCQ